jgi:hypothetical protein
VCLKKIEIFSVKYTKDLAEKGDIDYTPVQSAYFPDFSRFRNPRRYLDLNYQCTSILKVFLFQPMSNIELGENYGEQIWY